MSNDQTLLEGFFQASGRKRQTLGCGPIPKRTKDISINLSPTKSIVSMGFVSLRKEQTKQQPPQQVTRRAKAAPARKPRASKKLMQASAPALATRSSKRNANPATNDTFLQLDKALSRSRSPLKSYTPLNAGLKALSAAKQDTPSVLEPVMTSPLSPQRVSTVLKIPTPGASTREQIKRLTKKLQEAKKTQNYTVPPLPNTADRTLAKRLAEPTPVELKECNEEVLKPIEFPTEASCLSPSKKDVIQRRLALLKTPEKSPRMKEFREIQFTSPTKKQYNTTPLKSPQYQKSQHLTADTQLPLSYTQSILLDHFRCTDVVLSMLDRRKENCTFEKLQKSVTTMSGKQMTLKTLSQFMYLYPSAFSLSYQPTRASIHSPRRGQLELIIIATNDMHSESPIKKNSVKSHSLTNQELLTRKNQFHSYIIDYVKQYHVEYLERLNPPIIIPADKIVKRWHPNFNLDTVPNIPEGNMPQKPQRNTPQTAKQILASSQELLPTRFTRVMLKFAEDNTSLDPVSDTTTDNRNNTNELKGVSKNLIERIRIREQEKAKLNMIRDDVSLHRLDMLESLPEMCSIVRNMYLAQQRGTLPWADVLHKLKDSHHSRMEQKYMEEHLTLLLEVLPNWISLVNLKGTKFLKVKRNTPLNSLLSHLQCEKTRLDSE